MLILHMGGNRVERPALAGVLTPARTETHVPLPHDFFVDETVNAITSLGWEVAKEEYALARNGQRFFGFLEIARETDGTNGYSALLGLRNSHDKTFPAEFVCGSRVFVCDNLAFSGDVRLARKHTTRILDHIRQLILDALSKFQLEMVANDTRFEAYKLTQISDNMANSLIVQMYRERAITTLRIPSVVKEWYEPAKEEHKDDGASVWRLFNAATETLKQEGGLMQLPDYTKRLTSLMDRYCIDQGTLALPALVAEAA